MNLSALAGAPSTPADPLAKAAAAGAPDDAATSSTFASLLAGALVPVPLLNLLPPKVLLGAGNEVVQGGPVTETDGSGTAGAGLTPALQAKLARVVTRMRDEFGRDVTVVEGMRSQERQDHLFAQGRSEAGPVVTWTRNSLHSSGRAADLMIDGGYDDANGFTLLRQVAEQEGLHTLGARDPGHVELRGGAAPSTVPATVHGGASDARSSLIAAIGPLARVSTVATVATVASVATVAGVEGGAQRGAQSGERGGGEQRSSGGDARDGRGGAATHTGAPVQHAGADAYGQLTPRGNSGHATTADAAGDVVPSAAASRAERAMDAQDAPGPRALSHLTLSLDDGNGGQDRVRVGMRGASVGASFEMRDAASADRVSARLGELTRALEQRGLEPNAFQVRSVAPVARTEIDATRHAATAGVATRDVSNAAATRHDSRPDSGSDARQRSTEQEEQQERARRQQDEQRRRVAPANIFTLAGEEP